MQQARCLNARVSTVPLDLHPSQASLPAPSPDLIGQAVQWLAGADAIVVAAGAGMGVDSGLPDFRGHEGFWRAYPALARAQMAFAEVASPDTFRRDPRQAWGFYGHRLQLYRTTAPHAGFGILDRWMRGMACGGFVFTSNVDGQFQRAGFEAARLYECHGSIHWLQCLRPCCEAVWPADALAPEVDESTCTWQGELPSCPRCGGLARPNILMFDDWSWQGERYDAQAQRLGAWLDGARQLVVIELGAGTDVPSVRHFCESMSERRGARLVRINPRDPHVLPSKGPRRQIGLACGALAALQAIDAAWAAIR